ncbi:VOC family protein, partial [Escherichia coli]|nr:VOC family protein [Escherichia coli]
MHVPPGFTTLFPYLFVDGARAYLDFLVRGLGGEIVGVHQTPDGVVR